MVFMQMREFDEEFNPYQSWCYMSYILDIHDVCSCLATWYRLASYLLLLTRKRIYSTYWGGKNETIWGCLIGCMKQISGSLRYARYDRIWNIGVKID